VTAAVGLPEELARDADDRGAASRLASRLLRAMSPTRAADTIFGLIAESPERFQTALAVELVKIEGPARLDAYLASLLVPPVPILTAAARAVLASGGTGAAPDPAEVTALCGASPAVRDLAATLWDRTRYVPVEEYDGAPAVREFLRSPIFDLDPAVAEYARTLRFSSPQERRRTVASERLSAYQTFALRTGTLSVNDAHTGEPATYLGYYAHWDKLVYRFRGRGPRGRAQYLVVGGVAGQVSGLYLPDEDVLLTFDQSLPMDLRTWPIVKMNLAWQVARHPVPESDRSLPDDTTATVAVRIGGPENYAHVLWNSLGALARERLLGTLPNVREVRAHASEYFGPLRRLYPEIRHATIVKKRAGGIDGTHVADPGRILVPLGSTLLFPEAMQRVAAAADRRRDDAEVRPFLDRLASFDRRIYVALRVGDKAWSDAAVELPKLIDRTLHTYPDACFVLDGFSVPAGRSYVAGRWESQLRALTALVDDVRAAVREPDRVVSILGLDLPASIALIRRCTCYLTPLGTAHHKVDWLADLPGVVYASEDYARVPQERWPGFSQRLGSHEPRVVVGRDDSARSVRRQRSDDRRQNLANFSLDWASVWTELEPILATSGPRRRRSLLAGARRRVSALLG